MEDFDRLSPIERCVERETKRLNDEFGKKTIDSNTGMEETDKEKHARDLLRHGYCDAEVLGRDFCRQHKFQQDSVVAVDIQMERKEAAKEALSDLLRTGRCDSHILGSEFCKKNAEKWLKTPKEMDMTTNIERSVKLPDDRIIVLPGGPVKSSASEP